jgi:hypothetical protein
MQEICPKCAGNMHKKMQKMSKYENFAKIAGHENIILICRKKWRENATKKCAGNMINMQKKMTNIQCGYIMKNMQENILK